MSTRAHIHTGAHTAAHSKCVCYTKDSAAAGMRVHAYAMHVAVSSTLQSVRTGFAVKAIAATTAVFACVLQLAK